MAIPCYTFPMSPEKKVNLKISNDPLGLIGDLRIRILWAGSRWRWCGAPNIC